jgi:Sulfotransferase family
MQMQGPTAEGGSETGHRAIDPIRVLYIGGAGRSGSTLLDRVIGMHDGFCSLGELYFIWERSFRENQLCGCGRPFLECPFWEQVSQRSFGTESKRFDAERVIRLKEQIGWKRYILRQGLHLGGGGGIRDIAGCRVVVDSSKDPVHGFILARTPGIEVHVVHLVRDPRAVAFSWRRSRRRPEIHWTDEEMPKERIYTSAVRWAGENGLVERLGRTAAGYCRIRYEDFVVAPDRVLDEVFAPYGWLADSRGRLQDLAVDLEPTHTVSGNPMRFKQGKVELRLDSEWQGAMAPADRRLVTAATWPLMRRYDYPMRVAA